MEQNAVTVGAVRFLNVPLDDFKTPRKKAVKKRIQIKLAARCVMAGIPKARGVSDKYD